MRDLFRRALPPLAALLIFLALGVALLRPALFGDQVLSASAQFLRNGPFPAEVRHTPAGLDGFSDSMCCFVPWLRFAADAFAADGRIPLWKDTAGTGAPFVGNGQSAVFFPTNLLALLLGAAPVLLGVAALAKLAGGAFGAFLLARHLRLSFAASLLCGLIFGFGGFELGFLLHPLSNVSLLLPWLVLAADRVALAPSAGRAVLLAAVVALQHFGGHPETSFHCQFAVLLLVGARCLHLRRSIGRKAWRHFAWVVAALALGAALAAVQLLPLLEYMQQSALLAWRGREHSTPAQDHPLAAAAFVVSLVVALLALRRLARSDRGPLPAALLLGGASFACVLAGLHSGLEPTFITLLGPDWFGTPLHYRGPAVYIGEVGAFAGVALPLAALGLLRGRPRGAALTAGVALGVGWLAGYTAPVFSDLLGALPIFRLALNARLLLLALLATAVLAGCGLDALGEVAREAGLRWRLALSVLAPGLAAVAALACAVRLGAVTSKDAPPLPPGAAFADTHLVPAELMQPLFADATDAEPCQVFYGYVRTGKLLVDVQLLYGRESSVAAASWKTAPGTEGPSSPPVPIFRAAVPLRELPPGPARVRVRAFFADGTSAVSALLTDPGAGGESWLPFPASPAPGTTTWEFAGLALLLLLLVTLSAAGGWPLVGLRLLLPLLVGLSLYSFDAALIPLLPRSLFYPPSPAIDALRSARPDGRMLSLRPDVLSAEIPSFYGLADLRSYDGLEPARVLRMVDAGLGWARPPGSGASAPVSASPDFALLGLMGVRYLVDVDPHSLPKPPVPVKFRDWQALAHDVPFTVFENPDFLPRARLVGSAVVEPDDERALALLRTGDFPRGSRIVLAGGEPHDAGDTDIGSAQIVLDRPEQVRVRIAPGAAGWLLLSDTFFPGWKALVDGRPREIVRANVAFRAVAVQPGESTVEFRYEPVAYRAGLIVSVLSALLVLAAGARALVAASRSRAAPPTEFPR